MCRNPIQSPKEQIGEQVNRRTDGRTDGPECDIREHFDTNEYLNIFVSKNLHERMSEYIHIKNLTQTNVRINIPI